MSKQNILGIDVAKDKLSIFDTANRSFFEILNNEESLKHTLEQHHWSVSDYTIGLESTGDYSLLPLRFFVNLGFKVVLLNPLVTRKYTRGTIRNKKTDKSDAELICEMVARGEGRQVAKKDLEIVKKTLLRVERKLISLQSDLKRLKKSLQVKINNRVSVEPALEEVNHLIEELNESAKRVFSQATGQATSQQEKIIKSHPGCGVKLSAIISSEAGDISRFPSARQFKAYVGIDPKVYQSGQKDVKGRMTKRGNPLLRQALYLAAFVAARHDPQLKQYYEFKRSEGKSHTHALCAVSRKLCERIYATVTQNRMYEVRSPEGVR